jgi:hypothetical protein
MYVVEYDDGSGNTIKMHFKEEEYKKIFAILNVTGNPYPVSYNDKTGNLITFSDEREGSADGFLAHFFDTEEATLKYDKIPINPNKEPLYYYSTKETPSTNRQKGSPDISIEVNFNIAYGGKDAVSPPNPKDFNKNILSCYIKIQSGIYEDQYIKFTPKMDEKGNITIERDNKLYSYGNKDMKEGDTIDFTKLTDNNLPNLTFNIYQQSQGKELKAIYSNDELNQSGRDIKKSSLQNNAPQNELQLPKITNLQTKQNNQKK